MMRHIEANAKKIESVGIFRVNAGAGEIRAMTATVEKVTQSTNDSSASRLFIILSLFSRLVLTFFQRGPPRQASLPFSPIHWRIILTVG